MTTLTLTELWVAPVTDLTDAIQIDVRTESEQFLSPSAIRRYAGGVDRVVTSPGASTAVTFTALNVDRATWLALRALTGTVALFREPRGRAIFGMVQSVSGDEWQARESTLGSISFTVNSVTYSEIV